MAQFSILVPLPNTKIWDMAKNREHGLIMLIDDVDGVGKYSGKAVIKVNDLSEYELPILQNLAFKRFYIRPAYMWMRLKRLNNYTKFINTQKQGLLSCLDKINISKFKKVREGDESNIYLPPSLDGERATDRLYECNYGIIFLPHLPTLSIATVLHNAMFEVEINDFAAKHKTKKDFIEFISQDDSGVCVLYTVFLSEETDIKARQIIRSIRDDVKFIYCGTQVTWDPNAF